MVTIVQKVKQKDWVYTLYRSHRGYVVSVVCGGVAMYELNIPLSKEEQATYLSSDEGLDALVRDIREFPTRYSERNIMIEEGSVDLPGRVPAGQPCPKSGWWMTPAKADSQQLFNVGEIFPVITESQYGSTFWIWDVNQLQSTK